MPQDDLDKETRQVLDRQKAIKETLESKGWSMIVEMLSLKIADIENIVGIDALNPQVAVDIAGRQLAAATLRDLLDEVNGIKSQYEINTSVNVEVEDEGVAFTHHD